MFKFYLCTLVLYFKICLKHGLLYKNNSTAKYFTYNFHFYVIRVVYLVKNQYDLY